MVRPPLMVVDVANVLGSRPDGWWRDRVGATRRLLERVNRLPLPDEEMVVVLEGEARAAVAEGELSGGVRVVHASGPGDDQILAIISEAVCESWPRAITVVTADRLLSVRAEALGASSQSPYAFRDRLAARAEDRTRRHGAADVRPAAATAAANRHKSDADRAAGLS